MNWLYTDDISPFETAENGNATVIHNVDGTAILRSRADRGSPWTNANYPSVGDAKDAYEASLVS